MVAYFAYLAEMIKAFFRDLGDFFYKGIISPWSDVGENFKNYHSIFTQHVGEFRFVGWLFFVLFLFIYKGDFYVRGICKPESELIAMDADFHRIAHGGKFDYRDFRSRNHSHIQQMLSQLALSAYSFDACALTRF